MTTTSLPRAALLAGVILSTACAINIDEQGHIEREDKRFVVDGVADLDLSTFDGAIEVRGWDRADTVVEIEKRGQDKEAVGRIQVLAEQKGSTISVDVRYSGSAPMVGFGVFTSTRARIVVNTPRKVNLVARTGDGSLVADRLEGRIELRTADGTVRAVETSGQLFVESGDGSIRLEDVSGDVEARTDDGAVRVSGVPSALQVRSGDGSIVLRIRHGAVMTKDWMVTTRDGSIVAELPDAFSALVEAEPGSGDRARSDLMLADVTGGTRDARTLRGRLGAGGRLLTLRTGDGSVRITNY